METTKELKEVKNKSIAAIQECKNLEMENAKLAKNLTALKKRQVVSRKVSALEDTVKRKNEVIRQKNQEIAALKKKDTTIKQLNKLHKQLDQLKANYRFLEDDNVKKQSQLIKMTEELNKAVRTIEGLNDKLKASEKDRKRLRTKNSQLMKYQTPLHEFPNIPRGHTNVKKSSQGSELTSKPVHLPSGLETVHLTPTCTQIRLNPRPKKVAVPNMSRGHTNVTESSQGSDLTSKPVHLPSSLDTVHGILTSSQITLNPRPKQVPEPNIQRGQTNVTKSSEGSELTSEPVHLPSGLETVHLTPTCTQIRPSPRPKKVALPPILRPTLKAKIISSLRFSGGRH